MSKLLPAKDMEVCAPFIHNKIDVKLKQQDSEEDLVDEESNHPPATSSAIEVVIHKLCTKSKTSSRLGRMQYSFLRKHCNFLVDVLV